MSSSESKAARRARGLVRLEVWLPPDVAEVLEEMAHRLRRSKAEIVVGAIDSFARFWGR